MLPLRLYRAGQRNGDLVRIIKANSPPRGKVIGDIRAMVAGNHVGARRLAELIEKYGAGRLLEICGELFDYTEVPTRQEISKTPSGIYEGFYLVEEDGVVPDKTYRGRVKVTIDGSGCHVDFTGTDPQARGPNNPATSSSCAPQVPIRITTYWIAAIVSIWCKYSSRVGSKSARDRAASGVPAGSS